MAPEVDNLLHLPLTLLFIGNRREFQPSFFGGNGNWKWHEVNNITKGHETEGGGGSGGWLRLSARWFKGSKADSDSSAVSQSNPLLAFFCTSVCVDTCTKGPRRKRAVDWLDTASGSNYHLKKGNRIIKQKERVCNRFFLWEWNGKLNGAWHLSIIWLLLNLEAAWKGRDSLRLGLIHDLKKQQRHENFEGGGGDHSV